ncbi:hypothetical protein PWR63_22105 [Paraburkholderia sp. A2WS-5]|uniref:hypothetical protein n=1 Tax=unclassified Paraburkholderia TaxID=2615204 RepID=UPI003B7EDC98
MNTIMVAARRTPREPFHCVEHATGPEHHGDMIIARKPESHLEVYNRLGGGASTEKLTCFAGR